MRHQSTWTKKTVLCAGLLAAGILVSTSPVKSGQQEATPEREKSAAVRVPAPSPKAASRGAHISASTELNPKARTFYRVTWGVDILGVKLVSSGLMLRFSYRVLDANKAKVLNDKKATPLLIDQKSGAKLEVPTLEKVGQLRQSPPPENGHEYWMVFSNKGEVVKPGSRVDIVIGNFRAKGLIVH
jgi:hypothetical protein